MTTCKANTGRLFCCCFGLCNQFHLATCKYTLVACRTNNKAELASGRGSLLWKSLCKCASVTAASHFSSSFSKTPRRRWPARLRSMPHKWSSLSSEFTEAISSYAENTNAQHGQSRHLMIFMQPAPHYKVHVTSTTRRNWLGNCRELAVCAPCAFYTGSLKQKNGASSENMPPPAFYMWTTTQLDCFETVHCLYIKKKWPKSYILQRCLLS